MDHISSWALKGCAERNAAISTSNKAADRWTSKACHVDKAKGYLRKPVRLPRWALATLTLLASINWLLTKCSGSSQIFSRPPDGPGDLIRQQQHVGAVG